MLFITSNGETKAITAQQQRQWTNEANALSEKVDVVSYIKFQLFGDNYDPESLY